MEDRSPQSLGLGVYHKVTLVNDTIPRTKRPLDLLEEAQPLESAAKKLCHLNHYCSTPRPSKKLPLCSPDSACFLGSSGCLDDSELENIVIRVSLPEDSAVALSVDTTRCFDSEPDDSLLEPSDDEQGNSPFNYTEEECREMLADDCLEDNQSSTGESTLVNQDVWAQSKKEVRSNCTLPLGRSDAPETSFRTIDELVSSYREEEYREMLANDCLEDNQSSTGESTLVNQDVWGQSEKEVNSNCTLPSGRSDASETSFRTIDELVSSYREEECREMLADDCLGDNQSSTRESTLVNQDVWEQSDKEVNSNCALPSATSFRTTDELVSNESLSQIDSSVNPGYFPVLENETANSEGEGCLNVDCLKSNQVICTLFDCNLQGPLNLSPTDADSVDQAKGDKSLEETSEKASQVIRDDHLQNANKKSIGYDEISSNSLVVEESFECLASKELYNGGMDRVEKLPSEIKEPSPFYDAQVKTSVCSPDPACDQNKDKVALLLQPKTSNVILNQDPSKGTDNGLSRTFGSQKEDLSQESTSVEESSDNFKLNSVVLDPNCGEDGTCGKKLGKVIPVPQVEERPKQRICISEAELEQKKHIYIQCVHAHVKNSMDPTPDALNELYALMNKVASREYRTQDRRWQHPSDLTMRKYPRFSKKPTQKCSLKQWVSRNLAHYRRFQDIPDYFQRSSVTASSNV